MYENKLIKMFPMSLKQYYYFLSKAVIYWNEQEYFNVTELPIFLHIWNLKLVFNLVNYILLTSDAIIFQGLK